ADGTKIFSTSTIKRFRWIMAEVEFEADFYTLRLNSCDLILGMPWLTKLGTVNWNFQQQRMAFKWREYQCELKGEKEIIQHITGQELTHILTNNVGQVELYCWMIKDEGSRAEKMKGKLQPQIETLLEEFQELFDEPHGLPPDRECNHRIHLHEGTNSVNLR